MSLVSREDFQENLGNRNPNSDSKTEMGKR